MKVLSLFDGLACGAIAFTKMGLPIERYVAYEIDKYAVQVASHNFPFIEQRGDVFKADFTEYEGFDWVIGGSPCTYWSIAQKNNRETEASGLGWELFSQYVRAVHEAKPKYFLYENNKSMSKEIRASIDKAFGFEAIGINSALVSAQNRQRLYWVGIRQADGTYRKADIKQPEDRGILLRDVLDGYAVGDTKEKAYVLSANYANGSGEKIGNYAAHTLTKGCKTMVAEPVNTTADGKAQTLRATCYKDGIRNMVGNDIDRKTCVAEPVCIQEQVFGRKASDDGSYDRRFEARDDSKSGTLTPTMRQNSIAEPILDPKTLSEREVDYMFRKEGRTDYGYIQRSEEDKSKCITANISKGVPYNVMFEKTSDKALPVYEVKDGLITIKDKTYPIKLTDGFYIIRKLTVSECKRLQTVPEWYDFSVISNSQAYKCLGNGWTCDVIMHLISSATERS